MPRATPIFFLFAALFLTVVGGAVLAVATFLHYTRGYGMIAIYGFCGTWAIIRLVGAIRNARAYRKALDEAAAESDE
jgi:hypothetical protein